MTWRVLVLLVEMEITWIRINNNEVGSMSTRQEEEWIALPIRIRTTNDRSMGSIHLDWFSLKNNLYKSKWLAQATSIVVSSASLHYGFFLVKTPLELAGNWGIFKIKVSSTSFAKDTRNYIRYHEWNAWGSFPSLFGQGTRH